MKHSTKRSILRWIHILFGLPLAGYIYGPPSEPLQYLPFFRYVYTPVEEIGLSPSTQNTAFERNSQ